MKTLAAFAWYFYLAWCPLLTFAVVSISAFVDRAAGLHPVRYIICSALLAFVAGPVFSQGFLMPWWAAHYLMRPEWDVYTWHYAIFCLTAQLVLGLLAYAISDKSAKRRT